MSRFVEVAAELGYWPALTDPTHIAARSERDARDESALRTEGKWAKMAQSLGPR
jgi:hypothetical protein